MAVRLHWVEILETLVEQVMDADYATQNPPYVLHAQLKVWGLGWLGFTQALARLVGCAVVYDEDSRTCTAVGNRINVEVLLASHADCYRTLTRAARKSAIAVAQQAGTVLRTERRPQRVERLAVDMVAWRVVELFPELRDMDHPREPVLKPHGGRLRLGGILPTQNNAVQVKVSLAGLA